MSDRELRLCKKCGVYTSNDDHVCIEYDGPPCPECGAGTVCCEAGAPGVGHSVVCQNGHVVESTVRVLEAHEVI